MTISQVVEMLGKATRQLYKGIPYDWRFPKKAPRNPLEEKPLASWMKYENQEGKWKKNGKNWFYADVTVPAKHNGVTMKDTEGLVFVHGWMPFTLWVDGVEMFKEEHAWLATGPITDPFPVKLTAGRKHSLILCVEPTELPDNRISVNVEIKIRPCVDMAVEAGAAQAQLRYAEALAKTAAQKQLVEKAAGIVDTKAIEAQKWDKALASIKRMEKTLEPFRAKARELTMHIIGHSHIDMDWMWTWPDTVHCIRRDFKSVTSMMDDYPDLTFTHSQVPTYKVVQEMDPDVFKKVQARVKEGRWENAAGTWVEGDLNMADGESVAHHMLYAADWTKENLNSKAKVLWEPDTFGHPSNMPQLAKLGEFDAYFHMRGNPGGHNNWPVHSWQGIDGSSILAMSIVYNGSLQPEQVVHHTLMHCKAGYKNGLHIWGVGDHGGAMSRFQIAILDKYRNKPVMPTLKFSTIRQLVEAYKAEGIKPPRSKGHTFDLFEGCFTTHASIKKYNRECETAFLTAEALSALAGMDSTKEMRDAWTTHLFNHFHDIFDGAAVHDTYINAHKRAEKALRIARKVTASALDRLARPVKTGDTVVVHNPLGFERSEAVTVALPANAKGLLDGEGCFVPVQKAGKEFMFIAENVPAFSARTYKILTKVPNNVCLCGCEEVKVKENGWSDTFEVETCMAKLQINRKSGVIGSYFDKSLCYGYEPGDEKHGVVHDLVGYGFPKAHSYTAVVRTDFGLNTFQILDEVPNGMAAWHIGYTMKEEYLLDGAKVELVETGPVFAKLRVTHAFRSSKIVEDVIVYNCLNRVDFVANIDWREVGNSKVGIPDLKVGFTAAMKAPRTRLEGPFTVYETRADGNEKPTQKFADVSGEDFGFTLYNDSKYGLDALGNRVRLTLLRNGYNPDPESDNGKHVVKFGFAPHGPKMTNGQLVRGGMSFNRPMIAVVTKSKARKAEPKLVIEGAESVVCTTLCRAEHSPKLIVRLFETSGKAARATVKLGKGITSAEAVNFLENPMDDNVKVANGKAVLTFRPFEVKTLLITCKGL